MLNLVVYTDAPKEETQQVLNCILLLQYISFHKVEFSPTGRTEHDIVGMKAEDQG